MPYVKPQNQADFQAAFAAAITNHQTLILDPDTRLVISSTMSFTLPGNQNTYSRFGLLAYGAHFDWLSSGVEGTPMFDITASAETENFVMAGLSAYGAGYAAVPGDFLHLHSHSGSAIRNGLLMDLTYEHFAKGIVIDGEVFESYVVRPKGSWCRTACMELSIATMGDVLSNIFVTQPSFTRAPDGWVTDHLRAGIHCISPASSVIVADGNFIGLAGPGIWGEAGFKRVSGCSFENCGTKGIPTSPTTFRDAGHAMVMDASAFGMTIDRCDASNTSGNMPYLLRYRGLESLLSCKAGALYQCQARNNS